MRDLQKSALGIELGSTRIKAVLISTEPGDAYAPIASGSHDWENRFENGVWTYRLDDVWAGIQDAFGKLNDEIKERHGAPLITTGAIGISAMMHGYLPFDRDDALLTPFRTWRNTMTDGAANALTGLFHFNIPQRWSVAHLYHAILTNEPHVKNIAFLTTLAGYVHYKLTGKRVLGVGDASGMLPVDSSTHTYDVRMQTRFDQLCGDRYPWRLSDILPEVLLAGTDAGALTEAGAALLDPSGALRPGIPLCPPEGDAGTGMVATNGVTPGAGNVSAGTSIFAMIVLDKPLTRMHTEIDMVTTPAGSPVAMVHCNNCSGDLDAWVRLLGEAGAALGARVDKTELYAKLYAKALEGDADCGGLVSINYYSGEPITDLDAGRPLFLRSPDSSLTLANYMRCLLFSAMATLKIGMDILTKEEGAPLVRLLGHGGLFKTPVVAQRLMAAALEAPVAVMESAGEGGAWGVALLAAYMHVKHKSLTEFLKDDVFSRQTSVELIPNRDDVVGFAAFMKRYKATLEVERAAVQYLKNR